MWINSRERLPEKDGEYMYQTVCGGIGSVFYTVEGGWNTTRDISTGELRNEHAIANDGYIARWFDAPKPDPIPEEWYEEYMKS